MSPVSRPTLRCGREAHHKGNEPRRVVATTMPGQSANIPDDVVGVLVYWCQSATPTWSGLLEDRRSLMPAERILGPAGLAVLA